MRIIRKEKNMNKLFTKIATLSVGLFMAIGVGVTVGASKKDAVPVYAATSYTPVTSLSAGDTVVFAYISGTTKKEMTGISTTSTKYGIATDYTTDPAGTYTLTVEAGNSTGSYSFKNGSNYLTWSSGNSLNVATTKDNASSWTIVVDSTDTTKVRLQNVGTTARYLQYNTSSPRFACYGNTSSAAITLLKVSTATGSTVSFNGNGGTGNMESVTDVSGSYTLPANGFTAPSGKAFSGWKAGNAGDLLATGSSYTVSADVTFYAQWADAYTVTYTAGSNGSGSYAHTLQPAGTYTLLPFASLTGVSASSGYRFANYTVGGVDKDPGDTITLSAATSITVNFEEQPLETTYNFATNFSTYASGWTTTYGSKTLAGVGDVGGDYAATIVLGRANKQSSATIPTLAASKNSTQENMIVFTLTETGYKIKNVTVTFTQRSTNTPTLNLFKGGDTTATGITALDSATIGTKSTLSTSNLNDTSFSVNCVASGTSNNCSVDLSSIYISIEAQAAYGTTDHIKVTGMPRTVYHIGEKYDSTGLAVTAYDGADESTANFKDITAEVSTRFTHNVYTFDDTDVPSTDMWIEYNESGTVFSPESDITIYVYVLAEYELVSSEPADWSGNYLIVSTDSDSNLVAMNGGLANPDVEGNYQVVTEKSTGIIEAGQENEWTISAVSGGYSIQGKSGKYIGRGTDSNGMDVSATALKNTLSISGNDVTISGESSGRKLSFSTTGNRFRYYGSGTVQLYKLVESDNADAYAQTFLGAITCDASGEEEPSFTIKEGSTYWSWSLLSEEYDTLTPVEKEQFRLGAASTTGDNIAQALAKYDYIVGKYNKGLGMTEKYPDFMLRDPDPISKSSVMPFGSETEANNTAIIVIVSISAISVLSIAVLLTLKKRKLR